MPKPDRGFIKPIKFYPSAIDRTVTEDQPFIKNVPALVFLISLVLILIYIFAVRFVQIETNVTNSNVEIESFFSIKLTKYFLLLPGSHRVKVSADGYYELRRKLLVSKDRYQEHDLNLTKLPGNIELILDPVDEVDVSIDGKKYGSTKKFILKIPAGKRVVQFSTERYLPKTLDIDVYGMGRTQQLFLKLEPAWANLKIDSSPENAQIIVNKKSIGRTPFNFEIMQGRRTIELKKTGYKNWSKTIQVKANTAINLTNIVMDKEDGFIQLSTKPTKAKILVNGKYIGNSPMRVPLSPSSSSQLQIIKDGFKSVTQKVSVKSGSVEELNIILKTEKARLTFKTKPKSAQLFVDQKYVGSATQSLLLPTINHLITIQASGYATYETTISPRAGFEKVIQIKLKTLEEASTLEAQINKKDPKNLMANKMRLFNIKEVTLGSSMSDPNRHVNESIRKIIIDRPFYISETEVTNAEFKNFLAMHSSGVFNSISLDQKNQPVVNVPWSDAAKFCNWLSRQEGFAPFYIIKYGVVTGFKPSSTGYRLPTEAEWEAVAQNGKTRFAWGGSYPPPDSIGNFSDKQINESSKETKKYYLDGYEVSAPVKSFNSNYNQIFDLYGNVSEWVHDFYSGKFGKNYTQSNLGPITGENHVIKGGSWMNSSAVTLGIPYRNSGALGRVDVGFRVARYAQ